jgi:sortase A
MKRRILLVVSILLVFIGLAMLIAPRVSNQVGKQIAHSTIEDFKSLKSEATADEVTDEMPSEENTINQNSQKNSSFVSHIGDETELTEEYNGQTVKPNFTRLYMDSVIYNEVLKQHQAELLINEQAYQKPSLNLSSYGIENNVYGYVSAPSIGLELPIYLGGNDDNMALGAAHMTYTSLPIGGESTNCVLSGHSGLPIRSDLYIAGRKSGNSAKRSGRRNKRKRFRAKQHKRQIEKHPPQIPFRYCGG